MRNEALEAPILFLVFNRPDTVKKVFEQIRHVKPKQLFIAADGPRRDNQQDTIGCKEVRNIVVNVDWDCTVKTLFRDKNLGCGRAVSSAISWFFDHVEEGIILEDDCLPDVSFFYFCQQMLERYRLTDKIMQISGSNMLPKPIKSRYDYSFSKTCTIWGWATWRRAWRLYDYEMKEWHDPEKRKEVVNYIQSIGYTKRVIDGFNQVFNKRLDTWDFQWYHTFIAHKAISIIPSCNLISNIGYQGAHTISGDGWSHGLPTYTLNKEFLRHPPAVVVDKKIDDRIFSRCRKYCFFQKIRKFLRLETIIHHIYSLLPSSFYFLKWGLYKESKIFTSLTPGEKIVLHRLARDICKKNTDINAVEIGSCSRASSCFITHALGKKGRLYCIDTCQNVSVFESKCDMHQYCVQYATKYKSNIFPFRGLNSESIGKIKDKRIDLLFMNGHYSFKSRKANWELFKPFLKTGSIVVFSGSEYVQAAQRIIEEALEGKGILLFQLPNMQVYKLM